MIHTLPMFNICGVNRIADVQRRWGPKERGPLYYPYYKPHVPYFIFLNFGSMNLSYYYHKSTYGAIKQFIVETDYSATITETMEVSRRKICSTYRS